VRDVARVLGPDGEWHVIGVALPTGGAAGTVLAKATADDYDLAYLPISSSVYLSVASMVEGGTAPTLAAFGPDGTVQCYDFSVNDFMYGSIVVPSDALSNADGVFSVDWTTDGTDTENVKWEIIYTIAQPGEAFGSEVTLEIESAGPGVAWELVSDDSSAQTLPEPSSVISFRLRRITNGGTDNADAVFGLSLNLSYTRV